MFNSVYMYERVHRQNSEISERYLYQNKVYRYNRIAFGFCNHFKDRITYNFKETKELQSNSFFKYIFFASSLCKLRLNIM